MYRYLYGFDATRHYPAGLFMMFCVHFAFAHSEDESIWPYEVLPVFVGGGTRP